MSNSQLEYRSLDALLHEKETEGRKLARSVDVIDAEKNVLRKNCPGGRITLILNEPFQHDADIEDYGVIVQTNSGAEILRQDWDSGKASYIGENSWSGYGYVDIGVPIALPFKVVVVMARWESPRTYTIRRVGGVSLSEWEDPSKDPYGISRFIYQAFLIVVTGGIYLYFLIAKRLIRWWKENF